MPFCVRIRSSDMAKYIGRNPYVSKEEAVTLFWERNSRLATEYGIQVDTADPMTKRMRSCTSTERMAIAAHLNVAPDASADSIANVLTQTVVADVAKSETTTLADDALAALPDAIAPVAAVVAQESQKMRGVLRENDSIEKTEQETGRQVRARNDEYYNQKLFTINDVDVMLGGMIDGAFEDEELVEIKERRNRLFNCINAYEMVQIHCYMHLTGMKSATLIERFNTQSAKHKTTFDPIFWKECVEELQLFVRDRLQR